MKRKRRKKEKTSQQNGRTSLHDIETADNATWTGSIRTLLIWGKALEIRLGATYVFALGSLGVPALF